MVHLSLQEASIAVPGNIQIVPVTRLPEDCLRLILSCLGQGDLQRCSSVCRSWHRVVQVETGSFCRFAYCLVKSGSLHFRFSKTELRITDCDLVERGYKGHDKFSMMLCRFGGHTKALYMSTVDTSACTLVALKEISLQCTNLRLLEFRCDSSTQEIVNEVEQCVTRQTVKPKVALSVASVSGSGLFHFWRNPALVTSVSIEEDLTEAHWEKLTSYANLETLELKSIPMDLSEFSLDSFTSLKCLSLRQTVGFFDTFPASISKVCLIQCSDLKAEQIPPNLLQNLIHLDIRDCSMLTAEGLSKCSHLLQKLEYFRFRGGGWDFRWNIADLVKSVLRNTKNRIRAMNVAAISNNHPDDVQLILNILSTHVSLSSSDETPVYLDFGLSVSGSKLLDLAHKMMTHLTKTTQVKFRIERSVSMAQCTRICFYPGTPEAFRPFVILSDLSSVRESFWHSYLSRNG